MHCISMMPWAVSHHQLIGLSSCYILWMALYSSHPESAHSLFLYNFECHELKTSFNIPPLKLMPSIACHRVWAAWTGYPWLLNTWKLVGPHEKKSIMSFAKKKSTTYCLYLLSSPVLQFGHPEILILFSAWKILFFFNDTFSPLDAVSWYTGTVHSTDGAC